MQHIITDEEVERFYCIYAAHQGSFKDARKSALTDFLANRPESTLGKLRPIAEMPETVPEGYKRYGWNYAADFAPGVMSEDTHFIDIQLPTPDPEAEERQRFEELFNVGQKLYLWGPKAPVWTGSRYELDLHENVWLGWKLAKAK